MKKNENYEKVENLEIMNMFTFGKSTQNQL
jgi:hypothetical protein